MKPEVFSHMLGQMLYEKRCVRKGVNRHTQLTITVLSTHITGEHLMIESTPVIPRAKLLALGAAPALPPTPPPASVPTFANPSSLA